MSSWLSGPREALENQGVDFGYRGERLGLPAQGPGSVAGFGRRLGALVIDWVASLLLVRLAFPNLIPTSGSVPGSSSNYSLMVLLVFGLEVAVFTWLASSSFGQRIVGISVVRVGGTRPGLWRAVVRTALLCLVIPAVIWDRDSRGLHDKAVDSVCVKAR